MSRTAYPCVSGRGPSVRRSCRPAVVCLAAAAIALALAGPARGGPFPAGREGSVELPGFLELRSDPAAGRVFFAIERFDEDFLYAASIAGGLGAFETQLDRNRLERARIVRFRRAGPRVFLVEVNTSFRTVHPDPEVARGVEDAFADAVLWAFPVAAEEGGRVIVEAGPFLMRDAVGAADALARGGQGRYRPDEARSAVFPENLRNFPDNTEIETVVTFAGETPGPQLRGAAADPRSLTLRQHHTFCRLPDGGFRPRPFDPRAGFEAVSWTDHAAPLGQPMVRRYIIRHRLRKADPGAAVSAATTPIVYYVDRAAPEPVRTAILEGVGWWRAAFEALGYRDAFRVEPLPAGADPLDIRYNVVSWAHRKTRGWSYASRIIDPRTGELIKSGVVLESQRVRRDYEMALALAGGDGATESGLTAFALARIRQLACHEVGHNLGLDHNFAASADGRASVMDYPHPLVKLGPDGSLDLSDAYAAGIGAWDMAAIAYGYQDFPPGVDEAAALEAILEAVRSQGLHFLANQDAVPDGSAHPLAHRWDNGADPVAELERVMRVRAAALARFSERCLRPGTPLAALGELFAPVYLFHRYQITAAAKVLGGLVYEHAVRGDGREPPAIVAAGEQRRALEALLRVLEPENLAIDERLIALLPPRHPGSGASPEYFSGRTGPAFDPVAAAEGVADLSIGLIVQRERAARLIEYHARNEANPGLDEVLARLTAATWGGPRRSGLAAEIQRAVQLMTLRHLMRAAADDQAAGSVRASAWQALDDLAGRLARERGERGDARWKAHFGYAAALIRMFQADPRSVTWPAVAPLPRSVHNPPQGWAP